MTYVDDDDDWDDREDPDEADIDDHDHIPAETVPCPYCGKDVYENAELCPHCRSYISREDSRPPRRPKWLAIGAIVTVVVILVVWVMKGR
jgi:predicted nucleic acid-binding Zn ribbon protein